jgi:hypothetical protein
MNTTFTLKSVEFSIAGESVKIGEISTTVSDYNLLEGLQVAKELPAVARELKDIIVEGINEVQGVTEPSFEEPTSDVEEAIRNLADILDVDPTQVTIADPLKVEEKTVVNEKGIKAVLDAIVERGGYWSHDANQYNVQHKYNDEGMENPYNVESVEF